MFSTAFLVFFLINRDNNRTEKIKNSEILYTIISCCTPYPKFISMAEIEFNKRHNALIKISVLNKKMTNFS